MLCKSVSESMERGGVYFSEPDSTYCRTNLPFNWFQSHANISLSHLIRRMQLESECPKVPGYGNCTCSSTRMGVTLENDGEPSYDFVASVDCSNLNLTELPDKLPMDTIELNITNNKVNRSSI